MKRVVLTTGILIALAASPLIAEHRNEGCQAFRVIEHFKKTLNLSEDQVTRLENIADAYWHNFDENGKKLEAAEKLVDDAEHSENPDFARLERLMHDADNFKIAMRLDKVKERRAMFDVLTPEQRKQITERIEKRHQETADSSDSKATPKRKRKHKYSHAKQSVSAVKQEKTSSDHGSAKPKEKSTTKSTDKPAVKASEKTSQKPAEKSGKPSLKIGAPEKPESTKKAATVTPAKKATKPAKPSN